MSNRGKNLVSFLEMVTEVFIAIPKAVTPPATNQMGSVLPGQCEAVIRLRALKFSASWLNTNLAYSEPHSMGCYYERLSRNKFKRLGHKNFKEEILASQKSERGRQILYINAYMGFPGASVVKNLPASRWCGFNPWVKRIPWRKKWLRAWEIPWTEEPGRLQSMASQGVGHNLASKQQYRLYMESRKMVLIYLCAEQEKRHWCGKWMWGHSEGRREWDKLRE